MANAPASRLPTPDEFDRLLRQSRAEVQAEAERERRRGLPDQALLWMAIPPGWTLELAEACRFPAGKAGPAETFARMVEAGWVRVDRPPEAPPSPADPLPPSSSRVGARAARTTNRPPPAPLYVMLPERRSEILTPYLDGRRQGELRKTVAVVGQQMAQVLLDQPLTPASIKERMKRAGAPAGVPAAVARWAALAARADSVEAVVEALEFQVDAALQADDSGRALDWIDAARPLAELLLRDRQPELDTALYRAARRLELYHRQRYDRQHIRSFLRRPEQLDAVDALLKADGDRWALHFIGAGGVGKTMLMRFLSLGMPDEESGERTLDASIARVDFDYLNPDFPRQRPGLLLWAFADELRLFDRSGEATRDLNRVTRRLVDLHQELVLSPPGTELVTDDPRFLAVLELYAGALLRLPQPIVLLVDTCEELAKARPGGGGLQNVLETFNILERLHARVPSLKVIFGGRRPLAGAGDAWTCAACGMVERPYLRLHEIRGFTHDDARRYMNREKVPAELQSAVIEASSPDAGSVIQIGYSDPGAAPASVPRCNPYDLSLYATWARDDPPDDPEVLRRATNETYVDLRIIGRLHFPPLKEVMPAMALLGHFDRDLLRAMSDADEETFERLYAELLQQEWIDTHHGVLADGAAGPLILDVEEGIRRRLQAYFTQHRSGLSTARQRAADALYGLLFREGEQQTDLGAIDLSTFDAALRVLEPEPERAFAWWRRLEERIRAERGPAWALELTSFLLGESGAAAARPSGEPDAPPESLLRPAVLATHAAALLHSRRFAELLAAWDEVARKAAGLAERAGAAPGSLVADVAHELRWRAAAGRVAATRYAQTDLNPEHLDALWAARDETWADYVVAHPQWLAALVSAYEALVERAESLPESELEAARSLLTRAGRPGVSLHRDDHFIPSGWLTQRLLKDVDREGGLSAFVRSLNARAERVLSGDPERALRWHTEALALVASERADTQAARWADWRPPVDLAARVRLEFARAAYPAVLSPAEVLAQVPLPETEPRNADQARLASTLLRVRLAEGPLSPDVLVPLGLLDPASGELRKRAAEFAPLPPAPNVYRDVPPLGVTAAEVLWAGGRWEAAYRGLRAIVEDEKLDLETRRHADRCLARLAGRARWPDEGIQAGALLVPLSPETPGGLHAHWQANRVPDRATAEQALEWARASLQPYADAPDWGTASFERLSLYLDALESAYLARPYGLRAPLTLAGVSELPGLDAWWANHPDRPVEALRLALRAFALDARGSEWKPPEGLLDRVGLRRAAEIALEEADWLARRLPGGETRPPYGVLALAEVAHGYDDACQESLGRVNAGLLRAIVRARRAQASSQAGEERAFAASLQRLAEDYERLRTLDLGLSELPGWEALQALAREPSRAALDELPRLWRPWLVRMLALLDFQRQLEGEQTDYRVFEVWIQDRYAVTEGERTRYPADLAGWYVEKAQTAAASGCSGSTLPGWFVWGGGLIGIVAIAGALVGGFFLFRWLLGLLFAFRAWNVWVQIGLYGAALASLILFSPLLRAWVRRRIAASYLNLRVRPAEGKSRRVTIEADWRMPRALGRVLPWVANEVPLSLPQSPLSMWQALWRLLTGTLRRRSETPRYEAELPTSGRYRALAEGVPREIAGPLFVLRKLLGPRWMQVRLDLVEGLHGTSWEGALGEAGSSGEMIDHPTALRFLRLAEGRAPRRPRRSGEAYLATGPLSPQSPAYPVIRDGWIVLHRARGWVFDWSDKPFLQTKGATSRLQASARVLHLVGEAEERLGGVQFRLAGESSQQYLAYPSNVAQSSVSQAYPEEPGLRPEAVNEYPDLALCVVQGEPREQAGGERLDLDRRNADLARTFAAQVYAQGVPAVLIIPPLPPNKATMAVQRLALALKRRRRRGARALQQVVAEIQESILAEKGKDAEAAWEQAYDVCLYCTPDWDGRLT